MSNVSQVTLRKVQAKDIEIIYKWQQKKIVRKFSHNTAAPTFEEHKKWFFAKIKSKVDFFYMIRHKKNECGTIRFDYLVESNSYVLNWYLIPGYYGVGIGTKALTLALNKIEKLEVIAMVRSDNLASIKSLTKAGFLKVKGNDYDFIKFSNVKNK